MTANEGVMLRDILEECRDGRDGGAFNEVVVMLESTAASAEVWMDFDDLRFTPDGSRRHSHAPGYVQNPGGGVRPHHQRPGPAVLPAMDARRRRQPRPCASTCGSPTTTPPTRRAMSSSCRCWRSTPALSPSPPKPTAPRAATRRPTSLEITDKPPRPVGVVVSRDKRAPTRGAPTENTLRQVGATLVVAPVATQPVPGQSPG